MLSLVLGAICFTGIHFGIAGTPLRDSAIAALGEGAYRVVFSIVSLAAIVWLVMAYKDAPYVATWGIPEWWKPIAIILMLPAFLLAVIGLTTPNPTSVGQEGRVARLPEGIVRVTRHPFLIGVGLWAVVHLIANGDVASFIFFGALAITALAGTVSIDAKRRRALGPGWQSFTAQTSIVPFAAIAAGRTRFNPGEIAASQWVAALIAYALMLGGHSHIIGVSPFPSLRPASDEITKDLSLSKIKFEHTDGVIRRELVSGECARQHEQPAYLRILIQK
jgi:uncharacterized membrane protein